MPKKTLETKIDDQYELNTRPFSVFAWMSPDRPQWSWLGSRETEEEARKLAEKCWQAGEGKHCIKVLELIVTYPPK